MNTRQEIAEQIRRMRDKQVEPEVVVVCERVYIDIGEPDEIRGVPVDCDCTMKSGWMVR